MFQHLYSGGFSQWMSYCLLSSGRVYPAFHLTPVPGGRPGTWTAGKDQRIRSQKGGQGYFPTALCVTLDEPVVPSKPQSLSPKSLQALHKYRISFVPFICSGLCRVVCKRVRASIKFWKTGRKEGQRVEGRKEGRKIKLRLSPKAFCFTKSLNLDH